MKKLRNIRPLYLYGGLVSLGVIGGLVYWNFWGCTDSCPMNANPSIAMLRGGLVGMCGAILLVPDRKKGKVINEEHNENQ